MSFLIAVTGPMGIGKTTLAQALARETGYSFVEERFEDNPYLKEATLANINIYKNTKWFTDQDFQRYTRACELTAQGLGVIIDKPFYEQFTYIAINSLEETERKNCLEDMKQKVRSVRVPDLLLDLTLAAPQVLQRIQKRGRGFEQQVAESWLRDFIYLHEQELARWPTMKRLTIDAKSFDFRKSHHVRLILNMINKELLNC